MPAFEVLVLGLDKKLYVSYLNVTRWPWAGLWPQYRSVLGRIDYPDMKGTACHFDPFALPLEDTLGTSGSLPNLPNYGLGPLRGSGCDTLPDSLVYPAPQDTVAWFPNPSQIIHLGTTPHPGVAGAFGLSVPRPNPTTGAVSLEVALPAGQTGSLFILDMTGRVLSTQLVQSGIHILDMQAFDAGLYTCLLQAKGQAAAQKVLVVK